MDANDPGEPVGVRIGELSRRVGVSTELLRAWERRYQLLQPARSPKGYRLYAVQDELRVRSMQDQLARGLSAAEAARVAPARRPTRSEPPDGPRPAETDAAMRHYRALRRALDAYDDTDAQHVLDTMLRELSLTTVLRDVVMPYLAELGDAVGGRHHRRGTGALRQQPPPRAAGRARAGVGSGRRPTGRPRLSRRASCTTCRSWSSGSFSTDAVGG